MRHLILNNFWWKVTALLLAILVWVNFQPRDKRWNPFPETFGRFYTRYLVAHPVSISKAATDTREFKVTPSEVDITLSGEEKVLRQLKSSQVRATVDVADLKGKSNVVEITPPIFPPGGGIHVERITPDHVQVEVLKD
jgi:YbbR domain-containing protein